MKFRVALIATFASMIGCGDNSNECGPGTQAMDGLCTPTSPGSTCSDGTILDTASGGCVIDPNACQGGTVLVGDACVDPGQVTADVEEAAEPNGLGLFGEDSNAAAGHIAALKPVGSHLVIHGTIAPFQDADGDGQKDADVDTYIVEINAPSLVNITADGMHGLTAAFGTVAAVDANDPLATWQRFGINPTGDTSKRQLYFPAPGTYALAIADTRTLFDGLAVGPSGSDPLDYYVTIDALTAAPVALPVSGGTASSTGQLQPGEVKLFTVPMGSGLATANLDAEAPQDVESLIIANTRGSVYAIKAVADATVTTGVGVSTLGFQTGDTTLVVADNVYSTALDPTNYTLSITTNDAGALSKVGAAVPQPSDVAIPTASPVFAGVSVFYYDVASNDELTGMKLSFDTAVSGYILDENQQLFSRFTYNTVNGFDAGFTFTDYSGILRERTAGRYYFVVFDPAATAPGTITATSTYAPLTATAVTEGTVTASQTVNTYGSNPFTYAVGTDAWHQFGATGGTVTTRGFDPATAYGRLDAGAADADCVQGGTDYCADVTPLLGGTISTTPVGHIVLDDNVTSYLMTVHGTAAFTLDFKLRPHTVLGPLTAGGAAGTGNGTLNGTTTVARFLVKGTASNLLDVNTVPTALLDAVVTHVDPSEVAITTVDAGLVGATEDYKTLVNRNGWMAFTVTPKAALAVNRTFTLTATATAGVTYAKTTTATVFEDACTNGSTITLSDDDEGSSDPIVAPTGFKYYGYATTDFRVFSNGFVGFDTTLDCGGTCFYNPLRIPTYASPNTIVAPYWADLAAVTACSETIGTKTYIEWQGLDYNTFDFEDLELVLDTANNSIEFVYADDQEGTGVTATVGIESRAGMVGTQVGFQQAVVVPGSGTKFTPTGQ